ncbi:hypothetical protein EBZ37_13510, partial [bacterium]|nr:hypothetical protein [bacterium]
MDFLNLAPTITLNNNLEMNGMHMPSMWVPNDLVDECNNPTEAGNDKNGRSFPFYDQSSSVLEQMQLSQSNGIHEISTQNSPVDYIAPGESSLNYGNGGCSNPSTKPWFSGLKISKVVSVGWRSPITSTLYNNVVYLKSRLGIPASLEKKLLQYELIAYFRRWALNQYTFDAVKNELVSSADKIASLGGEAGVAKIFSNPDGSFAAALISFHEKGNPIARDNPATASITEANSLQPTLFSQVANKKDHHYDARFFQSDWHFRFAKQAVQVHSFFVVGTLDEVRKTLQAVVESVKNGRSGNIDFRPGGGQASGDTRSEPSANSGVAGALASITPNPSTGGWDYFGFACQPRNAQTIRLHYYAGSSYLGEVRADQSVGNSSEIAAACEESSTAHGFQFSLTPQQANAFKG